MRNRQSGVSLGGLLVGLFVIIILALLGMRIAPAYMEFFAAKKAMIGAAQEKQGGSANDLRKAFDARAAVDDIRSVQGADLEVIKEGGGLAVSFAYRKEVPLFGNLGVYIDFAASSNPQ